MKSKLSNCTQLARVVTAPRPAKRRIVLRPSAGPKARRCATPCPARSIADGNRPRSDRIRSSWCWPQNEGRLLDLVPIRHGRMSQSPFAFYRGTAAIMAADLAHTPSSGLRVQACGDAHLSNFGAFATPERSRDLRRQ